MQPSELAVVATTGAYTDLTGAPTLGTAAAAATGDFATAAQGALADTALQSITDGAVTNVKLADGAVTYPKLDSDLQGVVDPLRGFNADGATDDTANFTALRTELPNRVIDLDAADYEVTDIPPGPAIHGTYVIPAGLEGGGTLRKDALKLRRETSRKIAWGEYHSNWPQGKNGLKYNGTLFSIWMEGGGHEASDMHVRLARSTDNGSTWRPFERLFQTSGAARSCWAATIIHGRLFLVVRIHSGAHNDAAITGATIYSRRIAERREKKVNAYTGVDATGMTVVATNLSATYRIANCPKHGMLVGSIFNITNVGASVGGRTVSGDYTVTGVGADWFEFTHPSGAATSTQTATSDFTIRFREEATWTEHLFGGDTIYTEVTQFPGTTRDGSNAFYFHGAAEIKTDTSGAMYLGVTGGNAGPAIAKVTGLISGTPALSKMTTIDADTGRVEPVFAVASDGKLVGFLRQNNATTVGGLFYSTDDIDTFSNRLNVTGAANDFRYAPFGIDIDGATDTVHAVTTGNRIRGTAGTMQAGEVPVYKLVGSVSDIIASGWPALEITEYKRIWFANDSQGDTGNGVGIGACSIQDGILHVFMATETPCQRNDVFGAPDIEYDRIYLSEPTTEQAASRQVASVAQGEPHEQYAGRFVGDGAAYLIAEITTAGAVNWSCWNGLTVANIATGNCSVALAKPIPGARYVPKVTAVGNGNVIATVSNTPNESGFEIAVRNITTGGLTTATVRIEITATHQPYRTDWGK